MKRKDHADKSDEATLHPNMRRLLAAIRRMRFGRITEIIVADGVPLKYRMEQLVDLSRGEEPSLDI